ncbi:hypothetical protein F7D95_12985 [Prevotella copri]|uniref:Uncharacterized protein n=1 Tax=Segatella copri TaxID=165179 RepID=A0AA90ZMC8_9BACT|nr:hypothetical protein [Segatella copri]MQN13685.1 hypothetical protein [Segatella copri]
MTSISRHQKRRRSADHTSTNEYLGSLVMNGKELASDVSRLGYCAMANGNIVLGISRSDKVKDYVEERGGSFFRQFILLSDGVLPAKFQLHGKVERRALARTSDDHLILYRDPSSRNPLGFRRCPARIRFRRCYLHHRWQVPQFLSHP